MSARFRTAPLRIRLSVSEPNSSGGAGQRIEHSPQVTTSPCGSHLSGIPYMVRRRDATANCTCDSTWSGKLAKTMYKLSRYRLKSTNGRGAVLESPLLRTGGQRTYPTTPCSGSKHLRNSPTFPRFLGGVCLTIVCRCPLAEPSQGLVATRKTSVPRTDTVPRRRSTGSHHPLKPLSCNTCSRTRWGDACVKIGDKIQKEAWRRGHVRSAIADPRLPPLLETQKSERLDFCSSCSVPKPSKEDASGGRMSDNLRTFGGGGAPAIPILKSVIRTAGKQKRPSVVRTLFFSAACLLVRRRINRSA